MEENDDLENELENSNNNLNSNEDILNSNENLINSNENILENENNTNKEETINTDVKKEEKDLDINTDLNADDINTNSKENNPNLDEDIENDENVDSKEEPIDYTNKEEEKAKEDVKKSQEEARNNFDQPKARPEKLSFSGRVSEYALKEHQMSASEMLDKDLILDQYGNILSEETKNLYKNRGIIGKNHIILIDKSGKAHNAFYDNKTGEMYEDVKHQGAKYTDHKALKWYKLIIAFFTAILMALKNLLKFVIRTNDKACLARAEKNYQKSVLNPKKKEEKNKEQAKDNKKDKAVQKEVVEENLKENNLKDEIIVDGKKISREELNELNDINKTPEVNLDEKDFDNILDNKKDNINEKENDIITDIEKNLISDNKDNNLKEKTVIQDLKVEDKKEEIKVEDKKEDIKDNKKDNVEQIKKFDKLDEALLSVNKNMSEEDKKIYQEIFFKEKEKDDIKVIGDHILAIGTDSKNPSRHPISDMTLIKDDSQNLFIKKDNDLVKDLNLDNQKEKEELKQNK